MGTQFDSILNLLHGAEYVAHVQDEGDLFLAWYGGDSISVFQWLDGIGQAKKVHSIKLPSSFAKCPLEVVKMNAAIWSDAVLEARETDSLEVVLEQMTHSHTA